MRTINGLHTEPVAQVPFARTPFAKTHKTIKTDSKARITLKTRAEPGSDWFRCSFGPIMMIFHDFTWFRARHFWPKKSIFERNSCSNRHKTMKNRFRSEEHPWHARRNWFGVIYRLIWTKNDDFSCFLKTKKMLRKIMFFKFFSTISKLFSLSFLQKLSTTV